MCPQNALPLRFSQDIHMQKIRYPEVDKRETTKVPRETMQSRTTAENELLTR